MTEAEISLTGSAVRELANDVLEITLTATVENVSSEVTQTKLREAMLAALEIISPHREDSEVDVRTDSFQVSPRYGKNSKIDGYIGSASITIHGTDTAKISQLSSEIKTMVVSGTANSLSRPAKLAVESDLTKEAIADFTSKANVIAASFGYKSWVLGTVNIRVDGGNNRPRGKVYTFAASAMESAPASMPVEGGKSELSATVNGSIILKKK